LSFFSETRLEKLSRAKRWKKYNDMLHIYTYPTARNDDHGRSDNIILIEITSNIEITIFWVTVTKQTCLPGWFKALSERHIIVPVPASKCWYMAPWIIIILAHQKNQEEVSAYCNKQEENFIRRAKRQKEWRVYIFSNKCVKQRAK